MSKSSKLKYYFAKGLFYFLKPLGDHELNKLAKKYLETLAEITNTPKWATKNVRMQLTFDTYSGISRELIKRVRNWEGLRDYINSGNVQEYEISIFAPLLTDAPIHTHVAHEGSHAIRLNICARYDIEDPAEIAEFFGKAGEIGLASRYPEIKPIPLEKHKKSLKELEETLEKLEKVKNLLEPEIRNSRSIDFDRYKKIYDEIISPAELPGSEIINPERLKKFEENEIEKILVNYLHSVLISTTVDMDQETGRIVAIEKADKILENLDGFYSQSPEEIKKKFFS